MTYKCDICGRESFKKIKMHSYVLCSKHMHQLHKYGKFLDNIQRTNSDLNDYTIKGDIAVFNVYNQRNEKIDEFIIDKDKLHIVKYHKWRKSHGHIVTGSPSKGNQVDLSWLVMGVTKDDMKDNVIDHINGNPNDNRVCNLRICTQSENVLNRSFMSNNTIGFIGVSYKKDKNRYDPEIRKDGIRCHLGLCKELKEAVYKRYIAEGIVFKEFCNEEEHLRKFNYTKYLPEERKKELFETVKEKLIDKGLWQ